MSSSIASQLAMRSAGDIIGRHLGISIHHVVKVDFTAFVDVVDAMGGLNIDVTKDIVDPEYPGPNYTYETFAISAGPHHIDGETALKYARSRHTTSDFDRAARQQQLLQALAENAREQGTLRSPGKMSSLLRILAEHVETTMSMGDILGAGALAEDIDRTKIITRNLNETTGIDTAYALPGGFLYTPPRDQFNGAFVLLPVSIPDFPVTWKQIRAFTNLLLTRRSLFLQPAPIAVLNATKKKGIARTLGLELTRFGFDVETMDNASDDRRNPLLLPQTVITSQTDAPTAVPIADALAEILTLPRGPMPSSIPEDKRAAVTIIIGDDYAYSPLQDLLPMPTGDTASSSRSSGETDIQ
jgi:LCP family protein required for cell wall assembly